MVPLAGMALVQALAVSSVVVGTGMVMRNDLLNTAVSFEPSPAVQPETASRNLIISWFEDPVLVSGGENAA